MTLAAAIIDTRLDKLQYAISSHLPWLPSDTALHVFSDATHQREICDAFPCTFHAITLDSSRYFHALNAIMTQDTFWESFEQERVLIFQHDSGILRHGIEEFYEWDYIGAPFGAALPFVGNGGFSLRNPRAMAHICRAFHYSPYLPEDIFFPLGCQMLGYHLAPVSAARLFSCEIHFQLGTLGYHAIDRYLTPDQARQIRYQYQTISLTPPISLPTQTLRLN